VVHFPIAFLFGASLFYVLTLSAKREIIATTAFSLLMVGTMGSATALDTGIYAEPSVLRAAFVRGYLLEKHQDCMILTLCLSAGMAVWAITARPFPQKGRALFMLLLFVLLGVTSVGADHGARLVYDYNVGGHACPQPIGFVK